MKHLLTLSFMFSATALVAQFGPLVDLARTASAPIPEVVDVDGDGSLDVLTAAWGSGQVAWYPGAGAGTFGAQRIIADDLVRAGVAKAADLDGDGDQDIVASSIELNRIMSFRNDGAGFFSPWQVISMTAGQTWGLEVIDLNADGAPDVAAACGDLDKVIIHFNQGAGQFGPEVVLTQAVVGLRGVAATDLNGDGIMDILTASFTDDKVAYHLGQGAGTFGPQQLITTNADGVVRTVPVDLDADGNMDEIHAATGNGIMFWGRNNGNGLFTHNALAIVTGLRSVAAGDLNGDGYPDLVCSSSTDDRVAWYANNGTGFVGAQQVISNAVDNAGEVRITDMDGDGDQDVLAVSVASDELLYFANNGNGVFGAPYVIDRSEVSNPTNAWFAELNGDGQVDVLVSSSDLVSWYPGLGDGSVGPQVRLPLPGAGKVRAADADGDQDLDLLAAASGGQFHLALNDGTGGFQPFALVGTLFTMSDFDVGDVNGDGALDVVFGIEDDNGLKVALNQGNGTFLFPTTNTLTTSTRRSTMLADLDEDGDADLIWSNEFDDIIEWYPNIGSGAFGPPLLLDNTSGWLYRLAHVDVNGDQRADLVAVLDLEDLVVWYENLGNGAWGPRNVIDIMNGPRGLTVDDMDGDGDQDVIACSFFGDGVRIFMNDGAGSFSTPVLVTDVPVSPIHLDSGDLDGDGDQDVLITSNNDDRVAWVENYTGSAFAMLGRIYHDLDLDGAPAPSEPAASWAAVTTTPTSATALTDINGDYVILADSGGYLLSAVLPNDLWQVTTIPPALSVQLTAQNPVAVGLDLGIAPLVDTTIIAPTYTALPGPCGDTLEHRLGYMNFGTRVEQGRLSLDLDTLFTFVQSQPPPDVVQGAHYEWDFSALGYEEYREVALTLVQPGVDHLGDTLRSIFQVLRTDAMQMVTDTFPLTWTEVLQCAYDPNDKLVRPSGYGPFGAVDISTPALDYTIRFQNTGTAQAFAVVLRDQLSEHLRHDLISVLGYSHPPTAVSIGDDGELVVRFDGINLPDSASDPLGSQGYFSFRAYLLPGPVDGTIVANQAAIFFDLNPPILTNYALNTLVDCSLFDPEVVLVGGDSLSVTDGSVFQWYFNGMPIVGGTGPYVQMVDQGAYSVHASDIFGCSATTAPFLSTTSSSQLERNGAVLYPDPTSGPLWLSLGRVPMPGTLVEVWDAIGKKVLSQPLTDDPSTLEVSGNAPGMHLLRVISPSGVEAVRRFVVAPEPVR